MLSRDEFVRLSLELNLFFGRIAKEHSIFLESAFTARDTKLAREANNFKMEFEKFLSTTIALANGVISPEVAKSGELVTPLTLRAEEVSQFYTAITINSGLTKAEIALAQSAGTAPITPKLEQRVTALNERAINLTSELAKFKSRILNDVLACKLFTTNYPLLLDHILREARFYLRMLMRLQNRDSVDTERDFVEQEVFWDRIMAEHAKFIRGLLDPTEVQLISTANHYGREFDQLTREARVALEQTAPVVQLTNESLDAAKGIRDFKISGTQGLIECKIKAIAYPLLGDHVTREANHYIRILKRFETVK